MRIKQNIAVIAALGALMIVGVYSCQSGNKTVGDHKKLYGTRLTLPSNPTVLAFGQEPAVQYPDAPRILVYYDAKGCTSCNLKELHSWKPLIREMSGAGAPRVEFVFILKADPVDSDIGVTLRSMNFSHPVWCDAEGQFERDNVLPRDKAYHTFLLDRDGKIVLAGTPIYNPELWKLYKQKLSELGGSGSESPAREV